MLEARHPEVLHRRVYLVQGSNVPCHHLLVVAVRQVPLTVILAEWPLLLILPNALYRLDPTVADLSVLTCHPQEARDVAIQLANFANVERAHLGLVQ